MSTNSDFINDLKELYPEKYFILLGFEFNINLLYNYLETKSKNIHDFNPYMFKTYISSTINQSINIFDSKKLYHTGAIVFDTSSNILKIYDGSSWIDII